MICVDIGIVWVGKRGKGEGLSMVRKGVICRLSNNTKYIFAFFVLITRLNPGMSLVKVIEPARWVATPFQTQMRTISRGDARSREIWAQLSRPWAGVTDVPDPCPNPTHDVLHFINLYASPNQLTAGNDDFSFTGLPWPLFWAITNQSLYQCLLNPYEQSVLINAASNHWLSINEVLFTVAVCKIGTHHPNRQMRKPLTMPSKCTSGSNSPCLPIYNRPAPHSTQRKIINHFALLLLLQLLPNHIFQFSAKSSVFRWT